MRVSATSATEIVNKSVSTSEATLVELEAVLKRTRKKSTKEKKSSIYDFVGVLTPEEADEMKKAIEETCETVHPDDWK